MRGLQPQTDRQTGLLAQVPPRVHRWRSLSILSWRFSRDLEALPAVVQRQLADRHLVPGSGGHPRVDRRSHHPVLGDARPAPVRGRRGHKGQGHLARGHKDHPLELCIHPASKQKKILLWLHLIDSVPGKIKRVRKDRQMLGKWPRVLRQWTNQSILFWQSLRSSDRHSALDPRCQTEE